MAKPKVCILLGNGLTYDFYNKLAPETHPDPFDLLLPARVSPLEFPNLAERIAVSPESTDRDLIMAIATELREIAIATGKQNTAGGAGTPLGRDFMGNVDFEMEFRQCLWKACRDQDTWIDEQMSSRSDPIDWQWPSVFREVSKFADLAFVSYNYDKVHEIALSQLGQKVMVVLGGKGVDLYDTRNQPRLTYLHGNIAINQTSIHPDMMARGKPANLTMLYSDLRYDYVWPPMSESLPYAPSVIPPGFAAAAAYYPNWPWHQAKSALDTADYVLAVGLELSGIDLTEFDNLVDGDMKGRQFLHYSGKRNQDLAVRMNLINGRYSHVSFMEHGPMELEAMLIDLFQNP